MTTKNFIIDDTNNINMDELLEDKKQKPLLHTGNSATEGKKQHDQTTNSAVNIVSKDFQNVNNDEHFQPKIIKLSVDNVGYNIKPKEHMGAITNRIADPKNVHTVDLIQLSNYITSGHAFTISYAEGGMSDNNFVSADLVGLDFDGEKTVTEVLEMLKEYDIPANIVYYTYSHGEKGERFRVITALSETVTNKDEYKQIIKGYQFIFGDSTDNATVGAVQRFLGTNKGLARDVDPYTTASKQIFLELYQKKLEKQKQEQAERAKEQAVQPKPKESININGFDLSAEINRYNLLDYVKQAYPTSTLKPASGGFYLNPCPLCNSNDHLHITGNKFHSFGNKNCLEVEGIGIVQWLMYIEKMSKLQAVSKFKYDLLGIDEKEDKRAYAQAMALKEQEQNRPSAGQEQERPPFIKPVLNKRGEQIGEKVSPPLLSKYIRNNLHYKFVKDSTSKFVQRYVYDDGYYKLVTDDAFKGYIKAPIEQYNEELKKMFIVNETFQDLITDLCFIKREDLNANPNIINFQNGILNLETMELMPHSPEYLSTIRIPCDWLEYDEPTPIYDNFVNTLSMNNKEVQNLLEECLGVVISNIDARKYKKALIMVGEGDSGKSQYRKLAEKLVGRENCTSLDLEQLESRFGASALLNKRLAGTGDMGFMTIKQLKVFKNATGEDTISAEFKGEDIFDFEFKGFLWFCANREPKFNGDKGDHVYRRMMIVRCDNVIPLEKQDKKLIDKLYAERNGIVRKAVLALKKTLDNGMNFTIPQCCFDNVEKFKIENDSILSFIDECVVKRPTAKLDNCTVKVMYDVYKAWCEDNNKGHHETNQKFKKVFIKYFDYKTPEDAIIKNNTNYYKDYTLSLDCKKDYARIYGYDSI